MGKSSAIEWTDATWNPWMGCDKVSPGCDNCYMFVEQRRYGHDPKVVRRSKTTFNAPLKWEDPSLVFTCSWSDWFHHKADAWRDEAWDVIRRTPQHTYQILTKRPSRIVKHLPADWGDGYPNVWLGVTVESQDYTSRAWQLVKNVKARVLFLSCEPLLGPVDLTRCRVNEDTTANVLPAINWVIGGGESQLGCRPCETEWLRDLQKQCADYGVPFLLKQLGGFPDKRGHEKALLDGRRFTEMPRGA